MFTAPALFSVMASAYTNPHGLLLWLLKPDISVTENALFSFIVSCAFSVLHTAIVAHNTVVIIFFIFTYLLFYE